MAEVDVTLKADTSAAERSLENFARAAQAQIGKVEVSFSGLKSVVQGTVAFLAARGVFHFLEEAISEAQQGQDAINELNNSLRSSGQFTQEASKGFQEFADGVQKTTRFGSEAVLKAGALIETIGQLGANELPRATKAALDLAAATGKDLTTAATLVGKAAQGNVGAINKLGIEFRKGATDAETFANALGAIEGRVGGRAEADVQTFSGAIARLKNQFNDVIKEIGNFIIESDSTAQALDFANKAVDIFSESVHAAIQFLQDNSAAIKEVVKQVTLFAGSLVVVNQLKELGGVLGSIKSGLGTVSSAISSTAISFKTMGTQATVAKISVTLLNASITALKAAATLGLSFALDFGINKFLELKDQVGGFGNAFIALGLEIKILFETVFQSILENFTKVGGFFAKFGLKLPGLESAKKLIDESAARVVELQSRLDSMKVNPEAERSVANLKNDLIGGKDAANELADALSKAFDSLEQSLKNVGKTQLQIIADEKRERIKLIEDTVKAVPELEARAQELKRKVILDAQTKTNKELERLDKERLDAQKKREQELADFAKKQAEERKSQLESIAAALAPLKSLTTLNDREKFNNDAAINAEQKLRDERIDAIKKTAEAQEKAVKNLFKSGAIAEADRDARLEAIAAGKDAEIKSITDVSQVRQDQLKREADLKDAQLAKEQKLREAGNQLVAKGLGVIADKFLPGVGSIITEVLGILAQGPEAVKEAFKGLVDGIGLALQSISDSIGPFIDGLLEAVPAIINKLVELAPLIIAKLIEKAPDIIAAQVEHAPKIAEAQLKAFAAGFNALASALFKTLIDITLFIPRLLLGALQSIPVVGELFKGIKLARGGEIPSGFPNDSFPARLQSGETVIPRGTTDQLSEFLAANQDNGGSRNDIRALRESIDKSSEKNLSLTVRLGEKDVAAMLLQINRQGFRTA